MNEIAYEAPLTVGRFMRSTSFMRVIGGPVGSGKTTGCIFEILRRACEQRPGPDGYRRTRWAIVRQTLQQLKMTILLDILTWLRPITNYKVSEQLVTLNFGDVVAEIYLIPLEDPEDQKRLLSMQLTGAWISEAIEIDVDLVPAIAGRCGRYPSKRDGGPSWFGIIADTNMPVIGSPWYKAMETDKPPDWQVFIQPGGLNPDAENLENLPGGRDYYMRLARTGNQNWIDRYVHAIYGDDPSGTAVYRESFKRSFHVAESLDPVQGQVLLGGQDFGRNPCTLLAQPDHRGRLLILEEFVAKDIGLETHVARSLKPKLFNERYMGLRIALVGDPSGRARDNREESCFDTLQRMGLPAFPAVTNDIDARNRAVESLLLQQRDGGPALVIDGSRCPLLVRALSGAYRYAKTRDGETKSLPEKKHPWSDLVDCLQYICLVWNAGLTLHITRKIRPRAPTPKPKVSARGWT